MHIINHENTAIALHAANHPDAAQGVDIPAATDVIRAFCDLHALRPLFVSPACEHYARPARGKAASTKAEV